MKKKIVNEYTKNRTSPSDVSENIPDCNKYDATYKIGKTTVHIVSPETVLGRKMTDEEKQKVLDEIKRVNIEIYRQRIIHGKI